MAEKHSESEVDSGANIVAVDLVQKEEIQGTTRSVKRCSSENLAPPSKSPRTDISSPDDARPETETQELESENSEPQTCTSPPDRRKSWRRATINRRSLPALPNPYQVLCRSISTSLTQNERLEKLMEASMKKAIDRTQSSLQTAAHSSMESFQIKVDKMLKEWNCLAKRIQSESQFNGDGACSDDPSIQNAMEKIKKAISRLEMEKESWETLLNKHRDKAEKLEKKVQKGQETGITPDSASLSQSSQYQVIESKPDYNLVLSRQQPRLQTMALIMDTQCKMVKTLLFIRDQSKLVVKETSGQLAAESGLPELSSDLVKNLITQPLASAMQ
ncbi:hypothetical protein NL108_002979 [Boleophthalmus pectinirostris]|uniref:kinetochore-associated protein DSN1 homolog n=1 Tax=Boleophthalmus pectinirostris TaxID=150288 RepID=UPI000A1C3B81|nr:kinetochore-associated protein DSN1 homolog [Boleophthalmus pectinirostris]KAJ0047417.1 hypothetical protein NL108_002979 [Boleophthalmus pectinirostris]